MVRFEHHITIPDCDTLVVQALSENTELSAQQIKKAMQKGAVWLRRGKKTQRLRRVKRPLQAGDEVHLYYDEAVLAEVPASPDLIEDKDAYSVWYKPYGLRSQGSKWGDHCTLYRWVEQHLHPQRPAFIVHRLDRAATGLMLVAHQKKIATALSRLFEAREIEKRYRVLVHGHFAKQSEPVVFTGDIDGKQARSSVASLKYDEEQDRSLLEVEIETGRKHQIRRHLSEAGYPVIGDRLYGTGKDTEDLQLTAYLLAFQCPVHQQKEVFRLSEDKTPQL